MDKRPLFVPADWVLTRCGNVFCDNTVWVPDLSGLEAPETTVVPVCSAACACVIVQHADIDLIVP